MITILNSGTPVYLTPRQMFENGKCYCCECGKIFDTTKTNTDCPTKDWEHKIIAVCEDKVQHLLINEAA